MTEERILSLIETEKKLLSALIIKDGVAIPEVAETLKPDDFYRPEHRLIYKTLLKLSDENVAVDVLLVEQAMRKNGDMQKVKREYLFGIYNLEYSVRRVPDYVKTVKEASTYRKLMTLGKYLTTAADREQDTPAQILTKVEESLTATVETNQPDVVKGFDVFLELGKQYLSHDEAGTQGISTGFKLLDSFINGLKKSDLIILAARPSMGKTAFAMNITSQVSRKYSTLVFSLEMSTRQLAERFLAADTQIHATKIQHRNLSNSEFNEVLDSVERLGERKILFDDRLGTTLTEMKLKARKVKREYGLDLIVIDYLQLMQSEAQWQGNRVQQVSEISRGLKCLARDLDVPVLALSQLSRSLEMRADKRPILSDLRDSGSIEQDADIVMFLHREEYYDHDDADKKGLAELIIAKNRNGAIGTLPFKFQPEYQLFTEITRRG